MNPRLYFNGIEQPEPPKKRRVRHAWEEGTRAVKCLNPGCPWRKRPKQRKTVGKEGPAAVAVEFSKDGVTWETLSPVPQCKGEQ